MIYKEIFLKQKNNKVIVQTTQYSNAIGILFAVADWDVPADALATMYIQKPSGTEVYTAGTVDGNDLQFTLTTQMTAEKGINYGQVKITSDGKVQNSFVFVLDVEECIIDDEAIASVDEFDALNTLINSVQSKIDAAEAATADAIAAAGEAREPVKVGARNMLLNTNVNSGNVHVTGADANGGTAPSSNTDGVLTWTSAGSPWSYYVAPDASGSMYSFEVGEYYYISGKIKSSSAGDVTVRHKNGSSWTTDETLTLTANTWLEFRTMMQVPAAATRFTCGLYSTAMSGATIQIKDFQLEKATVPSVYRPAIEDMVANAAANLQTAISDLTALINVINGGSSTKGYIRTYNNDSHYGGITFTNPNVSTTVPALEIDGNKFNLARNFTETEVDGSTSHTAYLTGMKYIHNNSTGVSRIRLTIVVDGSTTHTKYIMLANS